MEMGLRCPSQFNTQPVTDYVYKHTLQVKDLILHFIGVGHARTQLNVVKDLVLLGHWSLDL